MNEDRAHDVGHKPPPLVTDRFHIVRRLGSGGFGDVYEARDRVSGSAIALKLLREVDATGLLRFKREFRRVAQLVHPNLVRLYELIEEGEQWFFTMELVQGWHALDYLDAQSSANRDVALRHTFRQLAKAVDVLHNAGIVHRDIKPSNVMVAPDGRVVLLDFGIAKEIEPLPGQVTSVLIGTPDYLAPERMHRGPAQEPSDWYSVGVMLYQALTGTLPFEGDWLQVAVQKQERDPQPPDRLAAQVSAELSALCMGLLNRKPEQRSGAPEIRATLEVGAADGATRAAVALPLRSPRTLLVARTTQLDALGRAFDIVNSGRAVAVHMTGPSGIGKTTLVRHFLSRVRELDPSARILFGGCHQQESVAFNALDEFVDDLTDYLGQFPPGPPLVLPSQIALIGRVFPVFNRVGHIAVSFAESAPADPVEIRRQAFAALRALLGRLCSRSTLILAIDDVQWADRDSGIFLEQLLKGPDAPPLLLILSYRPQSADGNELIDRLRSTHQAATAIACLDVDVTALPPADAEFLLRRLLEHAPANLESSALKRVADESEGNPFLLHRLAHRILAAPGEIDDVNNATVISEEMGRLTHGDRRLVEIVAVARQPVPVDVAVKAAVGKTAESIDVARLFALRLLQMTRRGPEELLDIYHDRIRKPLLDSLTAESKAAHHQALIDAFEITRPHESERLAYHYELSGKPAEASVHALTAAHHANRALAFDKAVNLYKRALTFGLWELDARHSIELELARALANAGRGLESAQAFLAAAESVIGIANIRLRIKAADQYLRSGHLIEGQDLLRRLFEEVNLRWIERPWLMVISMQFHRLWARWLMKRLDDGAASDESEHRLARMEVLWAAAIGLSMFDPVTCAQFSARHLVFALKNRDDYRIALALAGEAIHSAHRDSGQDGRPRELLQVATRYARRSGAAHARAFVHVMAGITAFLGGRWAESAAESEQALTVLREQCIGVSWEKATAASFMCASNVFRGRLTEQSRLLPTLIADARARGDIYTADALPALTLSWVPHLVADHPDTATSELVDLPSSPSRIRWRVQDTYSLAARANIATYRGDPSGAWSLLNEYWPSMTQSLMVRVISIRVLLFLTRGKCAVALAASGEATASQRVRLLKDAESAARLMDRTHCGWAATLALAIRAGVASCGRDENEAVRLLERAAADLHAVELMPWYYAARWHLAGYRERISGSTEPTDEWWTTEGIAHPHRVAHLLIPGAWPERRNSRGLTLSG
jgi:serine/threonine protein kinase